MPFKKILELKVSKGLDLGKTQNNVTKKTGFFFTYEVALIIHAWRYHQQVTKSHVTHLNLLC